MLWSVRRVEQNLLEDALNAISVEGFEVFQILDNHIFYDIVCFQRTAVSVSQKCMVTDADYLREQAEKKLRKSKKS